MSDEAPFDRYYKFQWANVESVPPLSILDYVPKGGVRKFWQAGIFKADKVLTFDETKQRKAYDAVNMCVFCGSTSGPLTDEHIIPEALGADAFVKKATCKKCQDLTSRVESQTIDHIFFHVRKQLSLAGKNTRSGKDSSKLDIGHETTFLKSVQMSSFPTMLMMPRFDPASSFSRRPLGSSSRVDWLVLNLNCTKDSLRGVHEGSFAIARLDALSFSQFICKVALSFLASQDYKNLHATKIAQFISRRFDIEDRFQNQFDDMGCISPELNNSASLHELELGKMNWQGNEFVAVKVRLFAKFGMPTYYVTIN
jgi:HNH endonuclease